MKRKILYVASTQSHLERFHKPYLAELAKKYEVKTMATGKDIDFPVLFDKHFFSFANLRSIGKIRKILKREQFDAIILHTTLAAFLCRMAMWGMGRKKRPYVLNVVHGYLFSKGERGLRARILLLCERLLRGKTDAIAVMNKEDLEIAKEHRLCRGEITFINGMGVIGADEQPGPNLDLKRQFAPEGELLCGFVGELSGRKNQRFLINAVRRLREEGLPMRLLLLGEGGEREALEHCIDEADLRDFVFCPGNVEPIIPYLAAMDLYVSASRSEGLPFNIMEAMSVGLPIVASATKGQTDLLEEYDNSLYPLDDTDAFCAAVRRAYETGSLGAGAVCYPSLERYRLASVFDDNMKILDPFSDPENKGSSDV